MLRLLARNTIVGLSGTIALKAVAFVTTLVLARGLGEDQFGVYAFVGVFLFFFGFFTELGMERVLTRELARRPAEAPILLGNAILLKLFLSILAVPIALIVAAQMGLAPDVRYCILLAAVGLPLSLDLLFRSYFQTRFKIEMVYLVIVPTSMTFLALAALCVRLKLPVYWVFYAGLLNGALTLLLFVAVSLRYVRPRLWPRRDIMVLLLRDAGQTGAFVLMFMLAMRIDQVMLFKLRGAQDVGYYAVAVRVTEALSMLPEALMLSVFPILAASLHSAPERFRHTYRLSFKYLTAIILPIALALTLARHELVQTVFGERYAGSATALAILAWGMFFGYTGAVYLNLFIVHALHRLMLIVSLVALTANIALNFWLIPKYGAAGAAAATVFSNVVGFAFWLAHPQTAPFMRVCAQEALRPLLSVLLAWLAVWASGLDGFIAAGLSLLIFFGVLAALRGFSWSDVELVRRVFAAEDGGSGPVAKRGHAER